MMLIIGLEHLDSDINKLTFDYHSMELYVLEQLGRRLQVLYVHDKNKFFMFRLARDFSYSHRPCVVLMRSRFLKNK